jgi:hypothetical protein
MANLHVKADSLIPRDTVSPPGSGSAATSLRQAARSVSGDTSKAFDDTATAVKNHDAAISKIFSILRQTNPSVTEVLVTDETTGKVIAKLGDFIFNGVTTANYFSEIHVGDPLNTGNPTQALLNAAGGRVTVGQNGIMEVLDPFGKDAALIGALADTLPVTGAVDNGSGLIRLTVTGHTLLTGDVVPVMNVGGVLNATGIFTVTVFDANHVDLQNSVFVGTYTSGGTINRLLHITGAADNGSGLIRLTITAHGYVTGDEVNVLSVGGVPNATGQWIITSTDANHFDLQGSIFAGGYTSGGICLRYFAGILAQTIAIGPSFPNYKLRLFADGSLHIQNAIITVTNGGYTVEIGPNFGAPFQIISPFDEAAMTSEQLLFTNTGDASGADYGNQYFNVSDSGGVTRISYQIPTGLVIRDSLGAELAKMDNFGHVDATAYSVAGVPGVTATRSFGTSLTVGTTSNAVQGTPGVGQSNFSAVSSVVLNLHSYTWTEGILTS